MTSFIDPNTPITHAWYASYGTKDFLADFANGDKDNLVLHLTKTNPTRVYEDENNADCEYEYDLTVVKINAVGGTEPLPPGIHWDNDEYKLYYSKCSDDSN